MIFVRKLRKQLLLVPFSLISLVFLEILAESDYQWLARSRHNRYRAKHNARSLYSSNSLNRKAVKCAHYYTNHGAIDHTCPHARRYGENIWANYGGNPSTNDVIKRSVDGWYHEESHYKYRGSQTGAGHFTQMVWKESKAFGFGIGRSPNREMTVAVALYDPPGNYIGEYTRNVERPQSSHNRRRH